ncbi:unnamed protein product [Boreogadus saida]
MWCLLYEGRQWWVGISLQSAMSTDKHCNLTHFTPLPSPTILPLTISPSTASNVTGVTATSLSVTPGGFTSHHAVCGFTGCD